MGFDPSRISNFFDLTKKNVTSTNLFGIINSYRINNWEINCVQFSRKQIFADPHFPREKPSHLKPVYPHISSSDEKGGSTLALAIFYKLKYNVLLFRDAETSEISWSDVSKMSDVSKQDIGFFCNLDKLKIPASFSKPAKLLQR